MVNSVQWQNVEIMWVMRKLVVTVDNCDYVSGIRIKERRLHGYQVQLTLVKEKLKIRRCLKKRHLAYYYSVSHPNSASASTNSWNLTNTHQAKYAVDNLSLSSRLNYPRQPVWNSRHDQLQFVRMDPTRQLQLPTKRLSPKATLRHGRWGLSDTRLWASDCGNPDADKDPCVLVRSKAIHFHIC